MDRPLGCRPSRSDLLFPEAICASAFEEHDDKLCCARQLSELTGWQLECICDSLDEAEAQVYQTDSWRDKGATARMIFE